ncbi:glutathione S-transferase N-terminal domain-containing protein [Luminiphilus sp. nBUS_16]|uniref:glutathione S-transferase N-terminal domain-containing protein n=1 Tax=Luminiphilus sp. nBUS_16 TaxID=3395315 RepID=UPI003EB88E5F
MIKHYYWPTPNGHKTAIMLEEVELEYEVCIVNILEGDQFDPAFIAISPNNRIPAIVDTDGPQGEPYTVFESGAILMYLAEKTGKLWPQDSVERYDVIQWLMFQMGNVGPMFGQNGYFQGYCPEDVPLAKERYHNVCKQLYGVMDRRLGESEYLAGSNYSIADVATFPWTMPKQQEMHRIDITQYPNVKRWSETVAIRPAVQRGISVMAEDMKVGNPTEETYNNMFGAKQFKQ